MQYQARQPNNNPCLYRAHARASRGRWTATRGIGVALSAIRDPGDRVVAHAVLVEPVSNENSLLTGKLTGNFVKFLRAARDFDRRHLNEFRSLQQNSLLSRTGNFCEGTGNLDQPFSDCVSWNSFGSIRRN